MKQSGKIYTLVRPVLDYEESETTFAAFLTREDAEAAKNELVGEWKKIRQKIGDDVICDDIHNEESWDRYEKWDLKRRKIIEKCRLPFQAKNVYNYDLGSSYNNPESSIEVRELPLFK